MDWHSIGMPDDLRDAVEVGRGGFGVVYRAVQAGLGREVAVKVLSSPMPEETALERFQREAMTLGTLSDHPNIVTVHSTGVSRTGQPYIVMAFMRGGSVGALLAQNGSLTQEQALRIGVQIAGALQTAHEQGILHRDIKPSNILLSDYGEPALGDFGIAWVIGGGEVTRSGQVNASLLYAAPELLNGVKASQATEVYSLAATIYEMLEGRAPFAGQDDSPIPMLARILKGDVNPMNPDLPAPLRAVVLKGLSADPQGRFSDAQSFGTALAEVAQALDIPVPDMIIRDRGGRRDPVADRSPEPSAAPALLRPSTADSEGGETLTGPPGAGLLRHGQRWSPLGGPEPATVGEPTLILDLGSMVDLVDDVPTEIHGFTVLGHIASGRTGTLYKVFDGVRDRVAALKVIRPQDRRKARVLGGTSIWLELQHPNVLAVHYLDPGAPDRPGFILMDWVDGVHLDQVRRSRTLATEEIAHVVTQLCDALQHLHDHGLVHREVTSANILVEPRSLHVTLLDSGLARPVRRDPGATLTVPREVLSGLSRVAPEQLEGRTDPRSDLFSVGVLLYELLTGRAVGQTDSDEMRREISRDPHVVRDLATLVVDLLAPDPMDRPPSAAEVSSRLRQLLPRPRAEVDLGKVVVSVHGILTHAAWQRGFADVAYDHGLTPKLERWNFGYFSIFQFLAPWARSAKVRWFRTIYQQEFGEWTSRGSIARRPSIVAHSFGTYILGNALQRYPYLRFGKVILVGSILPRDFPWDEILERGQVLEIRNEFGQRDVWTNLVEWVVPMTGGSGSLGFTRSHPHLHQQEYDFAHSEYFERGHMEANWIPFLLAPVGQGQVTAPRGGRAKSRPPLGLYGLYAILLVALVLLFRWAV